VSAHPSQPGLLGRRTLLTSLAAASGLALAGCAQSGAGAQETGAPTASPSSADPATSEAPTFAPARAIEEGDRAVVAVTAATMWIDPNAPREGVDEPSLGRPVDLAGWNARMGDAAGRKWLLGKIDSQAAVGSPVEVDEVHGDWAKVAFLDQPDPGDDPRGMVGWVPAVQLVHDERFSHVAEHADTAIVSADRAVVRTQPSGGEDLLAVSFETRLPLLEEKDGAVRVALPDAEDGWLSADAVKILRRGETLPQPTADEVIATGKRFLGLPYLWAGVTSYGFDCSGFTYSIFRHHGVELPRDSGPQMRESGFPAVELEDLQPGDLLFFHFKARPESIRHVAVYVGDGKILHSPETGKTVEIVTLESYDTGNTYEGAVRPPFKRA